MVGDATRDRGEVRVRAGKEVQRDPGRKDILRERRLEERRETSLDRAEGASELESARIGWCWSRRDRCTGRARREPGLGFGLQCNTSELIVMAGRRSCTGRQRAQEEHETEAIIAPVMKNPRR